MARDPARLRGRQAQAAHNDELILQAAREVFLADPEAPVSAVAARAGVGIGALHHRYASKEDPLAHPAPARRGSCISSRRRPARRCEGGGDAVGGVHRVPAPDRGGQHPRAHRPAGRDLRSRPPSRWPGPSRCAGARHRSCSSAPCASGQLQAGHHPARRGVPDGVAGPRPVLGHASRTARAPAAPPGRHPRRAAQHRAHAAARPPAHPARADRTPRSAAEPAIFRPTAGCSPPGRVED